MDVHPESKPGWLRYRGMHMDASPDGSPLAIDLMLPASFAIKLRLLGEKMHHHRIPQRCNTPILNILPED